MSVEAVLRLRDVSISRDEVPVVHDVSLDVAAGAVTVLLGANGAGKTTLMDGIAGLVRTTSGSIELGDRAVHKLPVHKRAKAGVGYVEQARTTFRTLTVEQNLLVARAGAGDPETVYRLFPELYKRRTLQAGHLSGGEQQMLVLGRALVTDPKVVLLDEMSLGLAPLVVHRLMRVVGELAAAGLAVLLIEQFANLALSVGTDAYVLRKGRIVHDGPCAELRGKSELLHEYYFGSTGSEGTPGATGSPGSAAAVGSAEGDPAPPAP
ncbi:ABC transporter ATP-binding protein, partial [Streptomyces sp. SID3343]|uniref:ABC transporter ATP-binding protein n=1 Tax=Streptomyces sp. SID3343 TaxID=2690260 RepID=UPI00136971C3